MAAEGAAPGERASGATGAGLDAVVAAAAPAPARGWRRRVPRFGAPGGGWRALGAFWAVVLLGLGGGAAWLNALGPLPRAPDVAAGADPGPAAAPSDAGVPPPTAVAPVPPASLGPTATGPAPAVPSTAVPQPAIPEAPAPPPLPSDLAAAVPPGWPPAPVASPIPPPDPALQEPSRHGPLPRVGADGRTSIRAYARAWDRADPRPRVAVAVGGIGLHGALTEEAIRRLPPAVGLAVSPYAARPGEAAALARARGMETLLALPLEPAGYPLNDPGERALLTTLPPAENADRLDWLLGRFGGYVGVVGGLGAMRGERYAALPHLLGGLQDAARDRGLLYIDPRPGAPPPARAFGRAADVVLDDPATRAEIDRRLAELERLARERGSALGYAGDASPALVDRLVAWASGLDARGLALVPVGALARRPPETAAAAPGAAGAAAGTAQR